MAYVIQGNILPRAKVPNISLDKYQRFDRCPYCQALESKFEEREHAQYSVSTYNCGLNLLNLYEKDHVLVHRKCSDGLAIGDLGPEAIVPVPPPRRFEKGW